MFDVFYFALLVKDIYLHVTNISHLHVA